MVWPADACRVVRELNARVAELEESNAALLAKYEATQPRVTLDIPSAVRDLFDEARCVVDDAKALKCEFLRTVNHELRTPLNGVKGMLQVLRETDLNPEQREYVDHGLSSCEILDRAIRDILDYNTLNPSCVQMERKPLNVDDILCDIEQAYAPACVRKGLDFLVSKDASVRGLFLGDAARLKQIFRHLLDNALRFTPSGEIRVEVSCLSGTKNGRVRVCLSVHDTGMGIPECCLEHILDPFCQVETGLTKNFYGCGLGLAMVRKLVGLMDGQFRLESLEGAYTSAYCVLSLERLPGEDDC
ncbi:sensor histidine kinase [Desulfonatronum thiodismutans]|uniref:sensor histidine kinase n=1 Tax=Desulfonatronum thiodismutans TaxID=159290 RepID=UPI0013771E08|nr:HAMP domain-containing sensor histidine kinase [Desulfonatronum thiodismutans]